MIQTIMIADDSSTARMVIRRCLEIAGCRETTFIEVTNGQEALTALKTQPVDLLLTDLNMPVMDGRSLLKRVKASPSLTDTPVIVISSAGGSAATAELEQLGATAVLRKPISPATIADILQEISEESQEDAL